MSDNFALAPVFLDGKLVSLAQVSPWGPGSMRLTPALELQAYYAWLTPEQEVEANKAIEKMERYLHESGFNRDQNRQRDETRRAERQRQYENMRTSVRNMKPSWK